MEAEAGWSNKPKRVDLEFNDAFSFNGPPRRVTFVFASPNPTLCSPPSELD
jgi:hypothetical protein